MVVGDWAMEHKKSEETKANLSFKNNRPLF